MDSERRLRTPRSGDHEPRGVAQALPVDLPRGVDPKLVEFLDGLAELIARDLHRKGWGMAGSEGDSLAMMVMVENRTC